MAVEKILVMAPSGSGKTCSLMNLDPDKCMLIQAIPKRLTFPTGKRWKQWDGKQGSTISVGKLRSIAERNELTFVESLESFVTQCYEKHGKEVVIFDDLVYIMTQSFMANIDDKGYDKWNDLAAEITQVMQIADEIDGDGRMYFLTHIETDNNNNIKMKTAGQLVDKLVTPEGLFNTVIGAEFRSDKHWFRVKNTHPTEPYKTPMGLFSEPLVPSDLEDFDTLLCDRFGIPKKHNIEKLKEIRKFNKDYSDRNHEHRINELTFDKIKELEE